MSETPRGYEKRNQARMLTPEELAAIKVELEKQGHKAPERKPTAPETPAEKARKENLKALKHEIDELDVNLSYARGQLTGMKRSDAAKTMFPGKENKKIDPKEIEAMENQELGYVMQRESLRDAMKALQEGQPMPADLGATLQALQGKYAENLGKVHDKAQKDPNYKPGQESAQKRLQAMTELIERLK